MIFFVHLLSYLCFPSFAEKSLICHHHLHHLLASLTIFIHHQQLHLVFLFISWLHPLPLSPSISIVITIIIIFIASSCHHHQHHSSSLSRRCYVCCCHCHRTATNDSTSSPAATISSQRSTASFPHLSLLSASIINITIIFINTSFSSWPTNSSTTIVFTIFVLAAVCVSLLLLLCSITAAALGRRRSSSAPLPLRQASTISGRCCPFLI